MIAPIAGQAGSFYYDLGGGIAKLNQLGTSYGSPALDSGTSLGYNINSSLFWNTSHGGAIEFQLGLLQELASATGSTTGNAYGLLTVYPALRIQITRLYFTGGYTPLVWQNGVAGSTSYALASGGRSILGEAGFLMPITPEFSLGTAANAQFVTTPDGKGPSPALSLTLLMRFHFGYYGDNSGSSSHGSNEYAGWRYPFGFMR